MIRKIARTAVLAGAAAAAFHGAARAAPTVAVPQPVQYVQPVLSGAAQFNAMGFKVEVPNAFQPAFTYTPIAAPDGDATVDWYDITMRQILHNAYLVDDTVPAAVTPQNPTGFALLPPTKVWGYGSTASGTATYPGMTFSHTKGRPAKIMWRNALPTPHILPVDPTIMCGPPWRMGACPDNKATVHVHGAHTYDHSDGVPDTWFTPPPAGAAAEAFPAMFGTQWSPHDTFGLAGAKVSPYTYHFPMDQEAATLWYHDHASGTTRLNAYAGLAGFFLVHDATETTLQTTGVLPSYPYESGIAFQDKIVWATPPAGAPAYDTLGQIAFPNATIPGGPIGAVSITAEMFGNIMLANGIAWPKMTVEPRKYRLRLLNGNDSRVIIVQFTQTAVAAPGKGGSYTGAPMPFLVVGNEQGFLNTPVSVTSLTIMPGMRYDIVVDFTGLATAPTPTSVYMINVGPDLPFSGVAPPLNPIDPLYPPADPASSGQLMLFSVATPLGPTPNASVTAASVLRSVGLGTPPIPAAPAPGTAVPNRSVFLKEVSDVYGRLMLKLGAKGGAPMGLYDSPTELPPLGATEVWEVANLTPDAHPIHLHLVKFQIVDRENLASATGTVGGVTTVYPGTPWPPAALNFIAPDATPQTWTYVGAGAPTAPAPEESGYLDTFTSVPGTLTRLQATWDVPGLYVWHCHILSHEEYDMMRQYGVTTPPTGLQVRQTSANQPAASPPTFFAAGLTGIAAYPTSQNFEFQFWQRSAAPTGKWAVVQPWSTASNWTPPAAQAQGTYFVQVDMRTPGTVARQFAKVVSYAITGGVPTAVTVAPLNGSQPAGAAPTMVTFTASASPAGSYQYRFWIKDALTNTWSVLRPYTTFTAPTQASAIWTPPANTGGTYAVQVDVRAVGSKANADRSVVTTYALTPTAVALGANKTSPQPAATVGSVVFTATPTPATGSYEYRFWVRGSAGTWAVAQNYSVSPSFTWTPAAVAGTYYVQVDIRPKGATTIARSAAKVVSFVLQ